MAIEITMPKLSDTMEEGKIIKWLVKEGDSVFSGDVIAEIETDKADMEFESIEEGVVLKLVVPEGTSVAVGELIAVLGEDGEEVDIKTKEVEAEAPSEETEEPSPAEKPEKKKDEKEEEPAKESEEKHEMPEQEVTAAQDVVKASPIARRLAEEAGFDISRIPGTGPDGRIVKRDVEAALGKKAPEPAAAPAKKPTAVPEAPEAVKPVPELAGTRKPLSLMRKTVAKRMTESKTTVPHFYLVMEVDMGPVMDAREMIAQQEGVKLSVNDFIVKACAKALVEHPQVNANIVGDEIVYHDSADIGVAVALEEGLITPIVRRCHEKGLVRISAEIKGLAERARNRKLVPEEYTGAGFTVSNLGMYGIDLFAAIINPPESAILAVGRVAEVPVVEDGRIKIGKRMKATLSCDHRVVDGSVGAEFLATVKHILEHPMRMLI